MVDQPARRAQRGYRYHGDWKGNNYYKGHDDYGYKSGKKGNGYYKGHDDYGYKSKGGKKGNGYYKGNDDYGWNPYPGFGRHDNYGYNPGFGRHDDYKYNDDWSHGPSHYPKCALTACVELFVEDSYHRDLAFYDSWYPTKVGTYGKVELFFKDDGKPDHWGPYQHRPYSHGYPANDFSYDYHLHGLEPKSVGKMSIRRETVCENLNTNKKSYFFNKKAVKNPYKRMSYVSDYYGDSNGYYHLDNGFSCQENIGRTVYIDMPSEGVYGCGVLTLGDKNCKKVQKKYIVHH
eukprot:15364635-Ditylum_brightwellii.AAC.1